MSECDQREGLAALGRLPRLQRAPCMTVEPGWMTKDAPHPTRRELPLAEIRAALAAGDDVSIPEGEWYVPEEITIYGGIRFNKGTLHLSAPLVIAAPQRPRHSEPTHSLSR